MAALPASLQPVQGDPDGVKGVGKKYGTASTALDGSAKALGKAGTTAVGSLKGPRANGMAEASGNAVLRVQSLASNLGMASTALNGYGSALDALQTAVSDHAGKWQDQQDVIDRYTDSTEAGADSRLREARQAQQGHESAGEEARREFRTVAHRTSAALDKMTGALVPGGASKSPQSVLDEALGGWAGIVREGGHKTAELLSTAKSGYDVLNALKDLKETPESVEKIKKVLEAWKARDAATLLATQTRNLEEAKVAAVLRVHGADAMQTLRQYMSAQEVTSLADDARDTSRAASVSRLSELGEAFKATSKLARGVAVLGIVTGAIDIVNPEHDGWRGAGDRVAGAVSVGTGAVMLLQGAGVLAAFGPVGAGVFVGLVAAAALWTAGNFVADHWDDIKKGITAAGGWIADKTSKAFNDVKDDLARKYDATKKAMGTAFNATKGAITDLAGDAKNLAGDAKDKVTDLAGDAKDKVTDLAGDASDLAGDAKDKVTDFAGGAKDAVTGGLSKLGGLL